jgi:hypothetical protein
MRCFSILLVLVFANELLTSTALAGPSAGAVAGHAHRLSTFQEGGEMTQGRLPSPDDFMSDLYFFQSCFKAGAGGIMIVEDPFAKKDEQKWMQVKELMVKRFSGKRIVGFVFEKFPGISCERLKLWIR